MVSEWTRRIREETQKRTTGNLIKHYNSMNADGRREARVELKKRRIKAKYLPYKPRKKTNRASGFGLPSFFRGI